jgi:hypothetical protein
MTQYLLPMARNLTTGETVKTQDLTGSRYTLKQMSLAQQAADQLAVKQTDRTRQPWVGFVKPYTPTSRSSV